MFDIYVLQKESVKLIWREPKNFCVSTNVSCQNMLVATKVIEKVSREILTQKDMI